MFLSKNYRYIICGSLNIFCKNICINSKANYLKIKLQFNESVRKVIGFEDLGQCDRSPKFADKALVFIVRGIRKQFKRPVAFYFTNSQMNSTTLANIIKEVIKDVQSTGLTVISTVCDQAPTNVSAINKLRQEINSQYLKKGKENRVFGFEINDKDIIPLFDVPHLLKGLRNNLLTKDLSFIYDKSQKKSFLETYRSVL